MIYAFKDSVDGYYQVDIADGIPLPEWTTSLTPCEISPPEVVQAVIPSISPRQIRQALTASGLRSQVESAIASSSQDMKDWWEFSTYFERSHPEVIAMITSLGVTEEQADDLWAFGATL